MPLPSEEQIISELKEIYDPEIPVNIVDLGLIYEVLRNEDQATVHVRMTMTSMGCPTLEEIRLGAEMRIKAMDNVQDATVEVVWTPPWTLDMLSEDGKFHLQAMGFNVP